MTARYLVGDVRDRLADIVEDLTRVLVPHGSLCLELGDTYSGSGGGGGEAKTRVR
jgi:hypothetical protein